MASAGRRRTRVDEWYLGRLQSELQEVARTLRGKEHRLLDLKKQCEEADALRRELSADKARIDEELECERRNLTNLHFEVLGHKEACVVPAQLKKKSSTLMKFLDQEGGRLNTERHLRGLQAAAKLYRGVEVHAPSLMSLAGRAKIAMEEEFTRYRQLEQRHVRQLQQLHITVMKDVLSATHAGA